MFIFIHKIASAMTLEFLLTPKAEISEMRLSVFYTLDIPIVPYFLHETLQNVISL